MGSHEVVDKDYVFTKSSHMASIGAIFNSTHHIKQLKPWPYLSESHAVNYSSLSACQGDMKPFKGYLSTRGHLRSLNNRPQQKQARQLSSAVL